MALCPCGSGKEFAACCGPVIETVSAPTAEALMRARYTAHTTGAFEFLEKSMAAGTSDNSDNAKMKRWSEAVTWNGLEILVTDKGQEGDETGAVSFVARYAINGIEQEMREDAEFIRENGQWRYLDGAVHGHTPYRRDTPKTGRNDPCPCGSGKKYKKCCGQ